MLEQVSVSIFDVDERRARKRRIFGRLTRSASRRGDTNDKHKAGTFDFR